MAALKIAKSTEQRSTASLHDPTVDMAAEWKLARAKALLTWANVDVATGFGTKDAELKCDGVAIAAMEDRAAWLARLEPLTLRGAREMLNVVLTILAHHEIFPDQDVMGEGPILQILRNVREGLDWLDGDLTLKA